jgi:atypical dual specificity phosphatase
MFLKRIVSRIMFYPTIGYWGLMSALRGIDWWNEIEADLLLGGAPAPQKYRLPKLKNRQVTAVLNMCEEWRGPVDVYRADGIYHKRIEAMDFEPPTLDEVVQGVRFIEDQLAVGHKVLVHCKVGRGRSATVVLCWLMKQRDMTPETAQECLQRRRPIVTKTIFERQVVADFVARYCD